MFARFICAATVAALATACASEFRAPVNGKINGAAAWGHTTARLHGESTFRVDTADGLTCEGLYDALSQAPTITATATCNDGRRGEILIQRKPGGGGTAVGTFADGTRAQFVFGQGVSYESEFPGPDMTAPPAPASRRQKRSK